MNFRLICFVLLSAIILGGCGKTEVEEVEEATETTVFVEDYSRILVRPWLESEMLNSVIYDDSGIIVSVLDLNIGASVPEIRKKFGIADLVLGDYKSGNFEFIFNGRNFESLTVVIRNDNAVSFELINKVDEGE